MKLVFRLHLLIWVRGTSDFVVYLNGKATLMDPSMLLSQISGDAIVSIEYIMDDESTVDDIPFDTKSIASKSNKENNCRLYAAGK